MHKVLLTILFTLFFSRVHALVSTVYSLADSGPGSLRNAISISNNGDSIDFNVDGVIILQSPLIVTKSLTIIGPGAKKLAIDGNNNTNIFIDNDYSLNQLKISGLELKNAVSSLYGSVIHGWTFLLTLEDCNIHSSSTGNFGAISCWSSPAGLSAINLINCAIHNNLATCYSAGVYTQSASSLNIQNCTFYNNNISSICGGLDGTAIWVEGGNMSMMNVTFNGHTSGNNLIYVTDDISSGIPLNLQIQNSIFDNVIPNFYYNNNVGGTVLSNGSNIANDNSMITYLTATNDQNNLSNQLSPLGLQDNGGNTPTIALPAGSSAIDNGNPSGAPVLDQRNYAVVGNIDIGAYEFNAVPPCSIGSNSPLCLGDTLELTELNGFASTFNWSGPAGFTSTSANPSIPNLSALNAGSYTLTITDAGGNTNSCLTNITISIPPNPIISVNDSIFCEGEDLQLSSVNTYSNYIWNGPNGYFSNQKDPFLPSLVTGQSGSYTLQAEDSIGCLSEDTIISVLVYSKPIKPLASGPTSICNGVNLEIEEISLSIYDSLLFLGPSDTIFSDKNIETILPGESNYQTGMWSIIHVDTLSGCTSESDPIFVIINPVPPTPNIISNSPVCINQSADLQVASYPGADAFWFNESTLSNVYANGFQISVSNIISDTIFYVYYDLNGCFSPLDSVSIAVDVPPVATTDPVINACVGENISLSSNDAHFYYEWKQFGTTISNDSAFFINNVQLSDAGNYTLAVENNNGCRSDDTTVVLNVFSNPTAVSLSVADFCYGDTIQFSFSNLCSQTILRNTLGSSYIITALNFDLAPISADYVSASWYVECIDANGCSAFSDTIEVQIQALPPVPGVVNNGPVCEGDSAILNVGLVPQSVQYWYADNAFSILIDSGALVQTGAIFSDTTFYVRTNIDGCFLDTFTTVTLHPPTPVPDIQVPAVICNADNVFLTTNTIADDYTWKNPSNVVSFGIAYFINNFQSINEGNYTLSIIDTNGCQSAESVVFVGLSISQNLTLRIDTICDGEPLILIANSNCDSVTWTAPDGSTFFDNDTLFIPTTSNYYVDGGLWDFDCANICNTATPVAAVIRPIPIPLAPQNNGPICFNDSVLLSVALVANYNYSWFLDDTLTLIGNGSAITIPDIISDTVFVLSTEADGCYNYDTTIVQSLPALVDPIVPDTITACENDTLFLSTTTIGSSYIWTNNNGFTASSKDTFIHPLQLSDEGDYFLNYTDANGCKSSDKSFYIRVNPLPAVASISTADSTICDGISFLIVSNTQCDLMEWYDPFGNTILDDDSLLVTPSSSSYGTGRWLMNCTNTNTGCSTLSDTLPIQILNLPSPPAISNNGPVCNGNSITITAVQNIGMQYIWASDSLFNNIIDSVAQITLNDMVSDSIFYLEFTDNEGCSDTVSTFINVFPLSPAPNFSVSSDTTCALEDVSFFSDPAPVYNWSGPNGFVNFNQSFNLPFVDSINQGYYFLNSIDANSCITATDSINIVILNVPQKPSVLGDFNICYGDTMVFYTTSNCDSTQWINYTSANISFVTGDTLIIPPGSADYVGHDMSVVCFDPATGCASEYSDLFTVNISNPNPPDAFNDGPVCNGDSVLLYTPTVFNAQNFWYADSTLTQLIGQGDSIYVNSINADTIFYLQQVIDACTLPITQTIVNVYPLPTLVQTGPDVAQCEGTNAYIFAFNSASAYSWTFNGVQISNQQDLTLNNITLNDQGYYVVEAFDFNGCYMGSDSMLLTVQTLNPLPILNLTEQICLGDTLILSSTIPNNSTVQWITPSLDTLNSNTNSIIPTDIYYQEGTWSVLITDTINACNEQIDTAVLIRDPSIFGSISSTSPVCPGDSVVLFADSLNGLSAYEWQDVNGNIVSTDSSVTIQNIQADSNFFFYVTDSFGCTYLNDQVLVEVQSGVGNASVLSDTIYCFGDVVQIGTSPAISYSWTGPNGYNSTAQDSTFIANDVLQTGFYYVTIENVYGCTLNDSLLIEFFAPPTPQLIPSEINVCNGDSIILDEGITACDSVFWIGSGLIYSGGNIAIGPNDSNYLSGIWNLYCYNTTTGCAARSNDLNLLIVNPAAANIIHEDTLCFGTTTQLNAGLVDQASYYWSTDFDFSTIIDSTVSLITDTLVNDTTYYLMQIDSNACVVIDSARIVTLAQGPVPVVGNDLLLCEGDNINLQSITNSPSGYSWTGPNNFTSFQKNPVIWNASSQDSGDYQLIIFNSSGCPSQPAVQTVSVNSIPESPSVPNTLLLCRGDTIFLQADSLFSQCDSSYWVGPNGASQKIIGPFASIIPGDTNYVSGVWELYCIDTLTGCFSISNTCFVAINNPPNIVTVNNSGPVCYGDEVQFVAQLAGSNINYAWYSDTTALAISNFRMPAFQNIISDTVFYLILTDQVGCQSNAIPNTVNVLLVPPSPVIPSDTTLCEGDSLALYAYSGATIISYFWTSSNGFTSNLADPLLSSAVGSLDTGVYSLSVEYANGCFSEETSFRLSIQSLPNQPVMSVLGNACNGDSLFLSSNIICDEIQWIPPGASPNTTNPLISNSNFISIAPSDTNYLSGSWYMICKDTIVGCQILSDTINVTIHPDPNITAFTSPTIICQGDSVILNANSTNLGSNIFDWYNINTGNSLGAGANIVLQNPLPNDSVLVELTTQQGCKSLDTLLLQFYPLSVPSISANNTNFCEGDSLILNAGPFSDYLWSGPNGFSSTQASDTLALTTLDAGTYSLMVTDFNGCSGSSNLLSIQVNPVPNTPGILANQNLCEGDTLNLETVALAGANYNWFDPNLNLISSGTSFQLPNVILQDSGIYTLEINQNGCSNSNTIDVNVFGLNIFSVFAGNDTLLCFVDTISVFADPIPLEYQGFWSTNGSAQFSDPNQSSTLLLNVPAGINEVYWTVEHDVCDQTLYDTIVIEQVPPSSDQAFAGADIQLCDSNSVELASLLPLQSQGFWTQDLIQSNAGIQILDSLNNNTTVTGLSSPNTYAFYWNLEQAPCGVQDIDTVLVIINDLPIEAAIAGADIITCIRDSATITAQNPVNGIGYWTTNSNTTIIDPSLNNTLVTGIQGDTSYFYWNLSNGVCYNYAQDTLMLIIGGDPPLANFDSFGVVPSGGAVNINVSLNDYLTTNWTINSISQPLSGNLIDVGIGVFQVDMEGVVTDQSFIYELCNPDCPDLCDTALVLLAVQNIGSCTPPNVFTPNGDGVNDLFVIPCLSQASDVQLMVFNRWGDVIYETDQYQNQWNGTYNEQDLPDGTYFYTIRFDPENEINGFVEIRH